MAKKRYDTFVGLGLMLIALFIFFYSFNFSKFNRHGSLPVDTHFYPQLIGIGLFLCGLFLSIKSAPYQIAFPWNGIKSNLKAILFTIVYILCFEAPGYIISTFVFVTALAYFLGYRKLFIIIIYSAVVTGNLYIFLYVKHPRVHMEYFQAYAPELNPAQCVWNQTGRALYNNAPESLKTLKEMLRNARRKLTRSEKLLWSCIYSSNHPWAR